jgi:uncharacterized UBP type Zn finger protein
VAKKTIYTQGNVDQLLAFGLPLNAIKRGLTLNGNDIEATLNWYYSNQEDPTTDAPFEEQSSSPSEASVPVGLIAPLTEMGFSAEAAILALRKTVWNSK